MDTFLPRHLSALLPECLAASLPYCPFLPPSPLIPPRLHSFLPRQSTFLSSSLPAQLLQSTRNLGHQATLFSLPPPSSSFFPTFRSSLKKFHHKKAASKLPESHLIIPNKKPNTKKKKKESFFCVLSLQDVFCRRKCHRQPRLCQHQRGPQRYCSSGAAAAAAAAHRCRCSQCR